MMVKACFLNVLFQLLQKLIKIMKAFHQLQHLLSFRYVNMCLLEVASDEKCRSSHFAVGRGPSKFRHWGWGVKNGRCCTFVPSYITKRFQDCGVLKCKTIELEIYSQTSREPLTENVCHAWWILLYLGHHHAQGEKAV